MKSFKEFLTEGRTLDWKLQISKSDKRSIFRVLDDTLGKGAWQVETEFPRIDISFSAEKWLADSVRAEIEEVAGDVYFLGKA